MGKVKDMTGKMIRNVSNYVSKDLWTANTSTMSKWKKGLSLHLQAIVLCTRHFFRDRIGREAVALSFFSTMSAVPLIAVILFISSGVGLEEMLENMLITTFPDSSGLINYILNIAGNMVSATEKGAFGWISFLTFVWLVFWQMIQIGIAFNRVWHVKGRKRKLWKKIAVYFGFLISIPFVLLLFLSGWAYYVRFIGILSGKLGFFSFITENIFWIIFFGIASIALSVMYKLIPATKVHYGAALKSAFIVGVVFVVIQYLYMGTQVLVTRISGVYGALAFVPLFMVWMNLSWQTILYGASLSCAFQQIEDWEAEETKPSESETKVETTRKEDTAIATENDK